CRDCRKVKTAAWREANLERWRLFERTRSPVQWRAQTRDLGTTRRQQLARAIGLLILTMMISLELSSKPYRSRPVRWCAICDTSNYVTFPTVHSGLNASTFAPHTLLRYPSALAAGRIVSDTTTPPNRRKRWWLAGLLNLLGGLGVGYLYVGRPVR